MALFKISKGKSTDLGIKNGTNKTTEGYAYFTPDDGKFYIDIATANTVELGTNRIALNSFKADLSQSFTVNLGEQSSFWTLNIPGLHELKDGLIIHILVPTRPNDLYNVLNINGLGNKLVYYKYNEPLGDKIQAPAELTLIYREDASSVNQTFKNYEDDNNEDIECGKSGWIIDSSYSINKSDIYYGNLAGNAATATQLYSTPNNQGVFLRGDNKWTNKIIGDLYVDNIWTNTLNGNLTINGDLITNGFFSIGDDNFGKIYMKQPEKILITNLNYFTYFEEISNNESYPLQYNEENNYWNILNTKNHHNLFLTYSWKILTNFLLNIEIMINSEDNWDYFIIKKNEQEIKKISGQNKTDNILLFLKANDEIKFIVQKDRSENPKNEYYKIILTYWQEYPTIKINRNFTPENNNEQMLGTQENKWSKLYIGSKETYGSISQPIYWNDGVPTEITTLGIEYGGTGVSSFTADSIIMSGSTTASALTTRAITNNSANTAITTGTNIPTMNTLYYGLVQVNENSQSHATTIYVPTEKGNSGQFLKSNGDSAPKWEDLPTASSTTAGIIKIGTESNDAAAGNHIHPLTISNSNSIILSQGSTYTLEAGGSTCTFTMPAAATVTLNGTSTSSAIFYAPTWAGNNGDILKSNGSGEPYWASEYILPAASNNILGGIKTGYIDSSNNKYYAVQLNTSQQAYVYVPWENTTNITTTATNNAYYLLGNNNSYNSTNVNTLYFNTNVYVDASSSLYASKVYNAVWNDYAEYRQTNDIQSGKVYQENDNGCMTLTNQRLIPGCSIASDTFGSAMGKTLEAKTPMAVAGRVLAYTYQNRLLYHAGMAVCSAPNGTVDIMSREEIIAYPDCIIGYVSEIPDYEEWGSGHVQVDGRIWIKIK